MEKCLPCRDPRAGGHSLCDACLGKDKERYKKRTEAGICQKCRKSPANATRAFCIECREKQKKISLERYRKVKQKVFDHYGHSCECCGESRDCFLTIDHINGEGNKHRKEVGSSNIYYWLVKHGLPGGFQVLCMNCNCAKRSQSTCPCKEGRKYEPFTWVA